MDKFPLSKIIALVLIGVFIGYLIGTYVTIKAVVEIAGGFIDEEMVEKAVFQYKNHIGACYPNLLNASLYNNTGN